MSATALLAELGRRGIVLAVNQNRLRISAPAGAITPELRAAIQRSKPALLAELAANDPGSDPATEARRQRVLAILERHPDLVYAVVTDSQSEPGVVVVHIGIRGVGTGELLIDRERYDGMALLALMDKHGGESIH